MEKEVVSLEVKSEMETETVPVISFEETSAVELLKERTALKTSAINKLKIVEQWYNGRKNKAMKSYTSTNELKLRKEYIK